MKLVVFRGKISCRWEKAKWGRKGEKWREGEREREWQPVVLTTNISVCYSHIYPYGFPLLPQFHLLFFFRNTICNQVQDSMLISCPLCKFWQFPVCVYCVVVVFTLTPLSCSLWPSTPADHLPLHRQVHSNTDGLVRVEHWTVALLFTLTHVSFCVNLAHCNRNILRPSMTTSVNYEYKQKFVGNTLINISI